MLFCFKIARFDILLNSFSHFFRCLPKIYRLLKITFLHLNLKNLFQSTKDNDSLSSAYSNIFITVWLLFFIFSNRNHTNTDVS